MNFLNNIFVHNKSLDTILQSVSNNAENNYKDAAQQSFKSFLEELDKLKCAGKLSNKQLEYYDNIRLKYEKLLKDFHH